jgi:Sec-independent protein translocase protein TatA/wyosine [tRNA(Phe)-imidazoG37] synthetase (radical SAM superfamily)
MFKLSFAEILLFLIIFFVIAPNDIPNFFRKIGEYLGSFRKMWRDWQRMEKDTGITELKHDLAPLKRYGSGPGTVKGKQGAESSQTRSKHETNQFEQDSLENIKIISLEQLRKEYDFSQSLSVFKMLFDHSSLVRERAAEVLRIEPVFSFEAVQVPQHVVENQYKADKQQTPIEDLFADRRIYKFSQYVAELPIRHAKAGINYLTSFPGNDNLDLDSVFRGDKQSLLADFKRLQIQCRDNRSRGRITIAASYKGMGRSDYGEEQRLKDRFLGDMDFGTFKRIIDIETDHGTPERVIFFGGEPTIFPQLDLFLDEIEKRNVLAAIITSGLTDSNRFQNIVERDYLESVIFLLRNEEFKNTDFTNSDDKVYTKEQLNRLMANIEEAIKWKTEVGFRYILTDPGKRDWDFLDSFQSFVPRFVLKVKIVIPNQSSDAEESLFMQLKHYKEAILSLISHFTSKQYSRSYRLILENPYPLCFFSKEELYFVLRNMTVNNVYREEWTAETCTIDKYNNLNNFVFHPDGSYSPAPSLGGRALSSVTVRPIDTIEEDVLRSFLLFRKAPLLETCINCSLYDKGLCQVGRYTYVESA